MYNRKIQKKGNENAEQNEVENGLDDLREESLCRGDSRAMQSAADRSLQDGSDSLTQARQIGGAGCEAVPEGAACVGCYGPYAALWLSLLTSGSTMVGLNTERKFNDAKKILRRGQNIAIIITSISVKEKIVMGGQIYSIKDELNILRKFIDMESSGDRRCYTENEVSAAEARLHYKLPVPIRELYLYMADVLLEMYYLEPLELLHWEQNYLGFFTSPEADCVWGVCRNDDPNALYQWEQYFPEEAKNELLDYLEEFEECGMDQDEEKQALAMKYLACWNRINARYTEAPPYVKKLEHKFRYNCCLDAYSLFLVIHTLCAYGSELYCLKNLRCYCGDFPDRLGEEYHIADYFRQLREKIEREFIPITAHMELIDITPLPMAYIHKAKNALLLCEEWSLGLTLLTVGEAEPNFMENIQKQLDLSFRIVQWP